MRTHVELFAGCGGMALGLEAAGFEMLLANELSPMAAETFAYNILGIDLTNNQGRFSCMRGGKVQTMVRWINSRYGSDALGRRLRENPQGAPARHDELEVPSEFLRGNLIVGSVVELKRWLNGEAPIGDSGSRARRYGHEFCMWLRDHRIDLISGGPPCQSFSLAGLRDRLNPRNRLPFEFAELALLIQPKMVLLENVSGILRPFSDSATGDQSVPALEVATAFAQCGFLPVCLHLNAWHFGVAQNRPRFVMLGINLGRLHESIEPGKPGCISALEFARKLAFHAELVTPADVGYATWDAIRRAAIFYIDANTGDPSVHSRGRLDSLLAINHPARPGRQGGFPDEVSDADPIAALVWESGKDIERRRVRDAIGDLAVGEIFLVDKLEMLPAWANEVRPQLEGRKIANHQHRRNCARVRARFRIYQAIQNCSLSSDDRALLETALRDRDRGKRWWASKLISQEGIESVACYGIVSPDGEVFSLSRPDLRDRFSWLLEQLRTCKHSQAALDADQPAPATLSIPDDACHYLGGQDRTLTVREMARIQSFPDWFEFRSKVTTGGLARRFEVPQYTQVGNAVPPLMARGLGVVIDSLLRFLDRQGRTVGLSPREGSDAPIGV